MDACEIMCSSKHGQPSLWVRIAMVMDDGVKCRQAIESQRQLEIEHHVCNHLQWGISTNDQCILLWSLNS